MKIMKQNLVIIYLAFFVLVSLSQAKTPNQSDIEKTISKAQQNLWDRFEDNHWNYPTYLGPMFFSYYYFEIKAYGWENITQFNETIHRDNTLASQLPDGSWLQLPDENPDTSSIDASIANYWFLKSVGVDINDERMIRAKNWILSKGGVEGAQQMTRFKLAMFGQYRWEDTFYIPLFIFNKDSMFSYFTFARDLVAQWVYPHLTAFGYLRYYRLHSKVGAEIFELWANPPKDNNLNLSQREAGSEPEEGLVALVEEIFSLQRPKGSFGTYTVSTTLNLFCLKHFKANWPKHPLSAKIDDAFVRGFEFIEMNFFNKFSPYTGQLDDGRWWDTLLAEWALLESGEDNEKLEPAVDLLITDALQPNGGIAYGWEFEYAPDSDDTSVFVTIMSGLKNKQKYQKEIEKSMKFVADFQNKDGGYGAFNVDLQGNWFYELAFEIAGIQCSAEIFDYSSADITGHMLEAFAQNGIGLENEKVQKAIKYLEKKITVFSEDFMAWEARWGINYLYASGAIIPGLNRIGYNMKNEIIAKNIAWIVDKQNQDGGFGETHLSYNDPIKYNGKGKSTPTFTAWALLALVEVADIYDVQETIENAIEYLQREFWEIENGNWVDRSVVGTGHRKVIYLQYPVYSQTFPLIAISRYNEMVLKKNNQNGNINKIKVVQKQKQRVNDTEL